jgi:hypothetical protein
MIPLQSVADVLAFYGQILLNKERNLVPELTPFR